MKILENCQKLFPRILRIFFLMYDISWSLPAWDFWGIFMSHIVPQLVLMKINYLFNTNELTVAQILENIYKTNLPTITASTCRLCSTKWIYTNLIKELHQHCFKHDIMQLCNSFTFYSYNIQQFWVPCGRQWPLKCTIVLSQTILLVRWVR